MTQKHIGAARGASRAGASGDPKATLQLKRFPVDSGTVVEVSCITSDAFNKGSNEVTCKGGMDFSFLTEPRCSIQGLMKTYKQ